jgi:hypothetical protein
MHMHEHDTDTDYVQSLCPYWCSGSCSCSFVNIVMLPVFQQTILTHKWLYLQTNFNFQSFVSLKHQQRTPSVTSVVDREIFSTYSINLKKSALIFNHSTDQVLADVTFWRSPRPGLAITLHSSEVTDVLSTANWKCNIWWSRERSLAKIYFHLILSRLHLSQ